MPEPLTFINCATIGVSGTTRVAVQRRPDGQIEARVGIALLGTTQVPVESLKDMNPFDDDFPDNYAGGVGATEAEALAALKQNCREIADGLLG